MISVMSETLSRETHEQKPLFQVKLDTLANPDPSERVWTDLGSLIDITASPDQDPNQRYLCDVLGQKEPNELIWIPPGSCTVIRQDPEHVVFELHHGEPAEAHYPGKTPNFCLHQRSNPDGASTWVTIVHATQEQIEDDSFAVQSLPAL